MLGCTGVKEEEFGPGETGLDGPVSKVPLETELDDTGSRTGEVFSSPTEVELGTIVEIGLEPGELGSWGDALKTRRGIGNGRFGSKKKKFSGGTVTDIDF
ncbi:unnamed protein product [Linum trigynum]|uniref:Uncharacterized protein n=1 Tax=Linum trigynum TaxID=586398 RepID=A0AAV2CYF3_9ROSI